MERATRKREQGKYWLKTGGAYIAIIVLVLSVLPRCAEALGLWKPVPLTQGGLLMALVGIYVIMWRFDKLESRIKDVPTALARILSPSTKLGSLSVGYNLSAFSREPNDRLVEHAARRRRNAINLH